MKRFFLALVLICTLHARCFSSDIERIKKNMLELIVEEYAVPPTSTVNYIITPNAELCPLAANGSWPDIVYGKGENASWQSLEHLDRMLRLSMRYHQNGDAESLERAKHALDFWLAAGLANENWWFNLIGAPTLLYKSILLLNKELSTSQIDQSVEILSGAHLRGSGQNLLWMAEILLTKACITGDTALVTQITQAVEKIMTISSDEGIKPDYSFHQHYAQLYTGGYGAAYAEYAAKFIFFMNKTAYAISPQSIRNVTDFILEGQQWCTVGKRYDFSVVGREIVRPAKPDVRPLMCDLLVRVGAYRTGELKLYAQHIRQDKVSFLPYGNRYYYCSDYMIQRGRDFYFSVKNHSARMLAGELVNGENRQGLHLSDGCINLQVVGNEYSAIFPLWDWKRLPGITFQAHQGDIPLFDKNNTTTGTTFVGGVSNGRNGAAVTKFNKHGIKANKAWFCFDDAIVCLASGLTASDIAMPLQTSVNQCLLKGDVWVEERKASKIIPQGEHNYTSVNRVFHGGVLYDFGVGENVQIVNRMQQGSWHKLSNRYADTVVQKEIFGLYIKHEKSTYAYTMYPNTTVADMQTGMLPKIKILKNDIRLQAVQHFASGVVQLVVYDSSTFVLPNGVSLTVTQPSIIMLKQQGKRLSISASSPEASVKMLELRMGAKLQGSGAKILANRQTLVTLALPQNENLGKTVTEYYNIK